VRFHFKPRHKRTVTPAASVSIAAALGVVIGVTAANQFVAQGRQQAANLSGRTEIQRSIPKRNCYAEGQHRGCRLGRAKYDAQNYRKPARCARDYRLDTAADGCGSDPDASARNYRQRALGGGL
jgi:hypothetical protein